MKNKEYCLPKHSDFRNLNQKGSVKIENGYIQLPKTEFVKIKRQQEPWGT